MLKGAITAIVTPFKNGQLDEAAYRELIEFQIQGGINGIVPCGTTGESPTLSHNGDHGAALRQFRVRSWSTQLLGPLVDGCGRRSVRGDV